MAFTNNMVLLLQSSRLISLTVKTPAIVRGSGIAAIGRDQRLQSLRAAPCNTPSIVVFVINELPARIEVREPRLILCEDQELRNGILLLSAGKLRPETITVQDRMNDADRKIAAAALAMPGALFLGFTDGNRVSPKGHDAIQSLAKELGYERHPSNV